MAVYEAALEAVLDSIGVSEDDRLLFLDRYVMFEEMTSSEDGTPTPSEAELAVVTYIYDRGGIFGDGHQIRVVNDGRSWVVEDVQHVVVPE